MKKTLSVILALCLLCTMMLYGVSTIASAQAETQIFYETDTAYPEKGDYLKKSVSGGKVFWSFESAEGASSYYADSVGNRRMRFYDKDGQSVNTWTITDAATAALVIPALLPKNMRFTVQALVVKNGADAFFRTDVYVLQENEGEWQNIIIPLETFGLRNSSDSENLQLRDVYIRPMDDCTAEERLEYGETLGLSYPSVVNGLTLSANKASNAAWYTDNNTYLTLPSGSSSFAVKTAVAKDDDRWRFTMRNVFSSAYAIDANKVEEQYLAFRVKVPRDIQLRVRLQEDVNGSTRTSPKDAEVSVNRTLSGDGYQLVSIPLSAFGLTAGTDFVNIKRIFFYPIEAASLEVGETISYGAVEIWDGIPYQFKADIYEKNRYTLTCTDGLSASAVGNLKAGDSVVVTVPSSSYLVAGSLLADYTSAFGEARSQKLFIKGDTTQKGSGSGEQFRFVMPASDVTVSATLREAANMQAKDSMATLAASVKPENNGLRFLTRVYLEDGKLRVGDALYTIEKMGTQIIPTDLIGGGDNWSSAVNIPAAILYDKTEKYVDFTGVLSNIKTGNRSREFSARGYVTYNNGTGSVTVYTDTVSATYSALLAM